MPEGPTAGLEREFLERHGAYEDVDVLALSKDPAPEHLPQLEAVEAIADLPVRFKIGSEATNVVAVGAAGLGLARGVVRLVEGMSLRGSLYVGDRHFVDLDVVVDRVSVGDDQSAVEVRVRKGVIDMDALRRAGIKEKVKGETATSLRNRVPSEYRVAVDAISHFVAHLQASLDKDRSASDQARFLEDVIDIVRGEWLQLKAACEEASLACYDDDHTMSAAKKYTEVNLSKRLNHAPLLWRSLTKPYGYPGDHVIMDMVYRNQPEGSTASAKVFHRLLAEDPLARGVRNRKDIILSEIERLHEWAERESSLRTHEVLSIGCGPAREVVEYLQHAAGTRGRLRFTLVDQEPAALDQAYAAIAMASEKAGIDMPAHLFRMPFQQLIRNADALDLMEYDLIYCLGLFDYLSLETAVGLCKALMQRLSRGGKLVVANAAAPRTRGWVPEFAMDWTLVYRTAEDMMALADQAIARAGWRLRSGLFVEPADAYHILTFVDECQGEAPMERVG